MGEIFTRRVITKNLPTNPKLLILFFTLIVVMIGSPGVGKSLMARAIPGILPYTSLKESLEVTRIYSVADMLPVPLSIRPALP